MNHPRLLRRAVALALLASPFCAQNLLAQNLIALTADNHLVPVRATSPLSAGPATPVTGLMPGESLLGIDFRPATGQLYGLGDQNNLYAINAYSGVATMAGSPLTVALQGLEFGFDFNPTVDRIRIVSDTAQNLRAHPDTGVVVAIDGTLAFAAGDVNFGTAPRVGASAYTNSVAGATSTTLYGIDTDLDILVSQIPPNSGTLNTIGSLGRNVTAVAGFDITPDGIAYAALNTEGATSGTTQIFRIDLTTGAASYVGALANANANARVRGLAAMPPRPSAEFVALTDDGRLAVFASETPWAAPAISFVSGLAAGEQLLGIDFRPATGQLYALGSSSQLYVVDVQSGMATAIGSGLVPTLNGTEFGFDFNPTVDRIRIVSDAEQDLRAHPDTGAVVAIDGTLAYANSDVNFGLDPAVAASAYTNSLPGVTSTLLYGIDTSADVLVTQNPPNSGVLNTVGSLGRDVTGVAGFDIGSDGRAFAVLTDATGSRLCEVDLATGALTEWANLSLSTGASIRGFAVRTVPGLLAFGTASPGCAGPAWLGAAGVPFAGNPQFRTVLHRGPADAIGFTVLAVGGLSTPDNFGGLLGWLDGSQLIGMAWASTDSAGTSAVTMPLMGAWFGLDLYFQWVGVDACGPIGLSASAALRVTVQ